MSNNATYYWQVWAVNSVGTTYADGSNTAFWSFSTNSPPSTPGDPTPTESAIGTSLSPTLTWSGGDPDPEDSVTYDVYLQANTNPPTTLVSTDQSRTGYIPDPLNPRTIYYWRIVARDSQQTLTSGPVWRFSTGEASSQLPRVDVKINDSDGPVSLTNHDTFTVTWTSANTSACTGSGAMAGRSGSVGGYTDGPKTDRMYVYTMSCSNDSGQTADSLILQVDSIPGIFAQQLTAGLEHTCALTSTGGIKCWGGNTYGQLGDRTNYTHMTPGGVIGLSGGVSAITAGYAHTCALTSMGTVMCWGYNFWGQLGVGSTVDRWTPAEVEGLSGVIAIAAGYNHTCAIPTGGSVKCWGDNRSGQLGDGTNGNRHDTPVEVVGLSSGVIEIAAGADHTCALTQAGRVKCWGDNTHGQLGDGTTTTRLTPVEVPELSEVIAIAAGERHTCALTQAGGVKCWGWNEFGQLGDATFAEHRSPVDVVGLGSVVSDIAAGPRHTCALTTADGARCWGNNFYGQLGDGSTIDRWIPVEVADLTGEANAIAAGGSHTCALKSEGKVWCWGANMYGQLGDGTRTIRITPMEVVGLSSGVIDIAAGAYHTCAATQPGRAKCWGANFQGELGIGLFSGLWVPADVVGLSSGLGAVAAGFSHTCALTQSGGVKCWGENENGQLGDGSFTDRWSPVDVLGLTSEAKEIAAGGSHTCALMTAGGVMCWGNDWRGYSSPPVIITGLSGVSAITAGSTHTCALTSVGKVMCWGSNLNGQLGNGTTFSSTYPVEVDELSGVSAIAAGGNHTCAVTQAGTVKCWGGNTRGQLGDGTTTTRLTPVEVPELSEVIAIAAGFSHTCALTQAGKVRCWGSNWQGQLGDGSTVDSWTPVEVPGLAGVSAIAAGYYHTCAVTQSGGVECWGYNGHGQLGDGTTTTRLYPISVNGFP